MNRIATLVLMSLFAVGNTAIAQQIDVSPVTDKMVQEFYAEGKVCIPEGELVVLEVLSNDNTGNYEKGYGFLAYKKGSDICDRLKNFTGHEIVDFIREGKKNDLLQQGMLGFVVNKVKSGAGNPSGHIVQRGFSRSGFKKVKDDGSVNLSSVFDIDLVGEVLTLKSLGFPNFNYGEWHKKEIFGGAKPNGLLTSVFSLHVGQIIFDHPAYEQEGGTDIKVIQNRNTDHQLFIVTKWAPDGVADVEIFSEKKSRYDLTSLMEIIRNSAKGFVATFVNK